jgi:geranylgeranyl transferase type-2 subunit alpha
LKTKRKVRRNHARPPARHPRRTHRPREGQGSSTEGKKKTRERERERGHLIFDAPHVKKTKKPLATSTFFPPQLALLSRLSDEVLARRAEHRSDPESLKLCAALIEHNPEVYTAWNWRREVVGPLLLEKDGKKEEEEGPSTSTSSDDDIRVKLAQAELDLTEKSLRRNPKCYSAWHHRRWVLLQRPFLKHLLQKELVLVDKLLDADARNFHAWAHRRAVAREAGVLPKESEEAAMRRVEDNFSNYSAWHERSATLLLEEAATEKNDGENDDDDDDGGKKSSASPPPLLSASVLEREYDLVQQAVFTDPEDQAPWLYHRWLLSQSVERFRRARKAKASGDSGDDGDKATTAAAAAEALAATLEAESTACEELLEAEPDRSKCKWPLLTLARLSEARAWLERKRGAKNDGDDGSDSDGESERKGVSRKPPAAAVAIFEQLAELDPLRRNFYRDAASGRVFV